ncbi:MAG: alpha/beta fold hydrolase [Arachnia sp.]
MPTLTIPGPTPVALHFEDTGGSGRPLVLIHGWPLSGEAFADNVQTFIDKGLRVVTYDRRGFGRSDKAKDGYDYDTLSEDLNHLLTELDLTDAVLLGFSMGGGEVARYVGRHGTNRLSGIVLSSSICPALAVTQDNPDGAMPVSAFTDMAQQCLHGRDGFLDQFTTAFFSNADGLTVDEGTRQKALSLARQSDPRAASATIEAWATDLRDDCARIDVPLLVLHGDGDQNVPMEASGACMPAIVKHAELHVIHGGPHGLNVSHKEEWETAILRFLAAL